MRSALSPPALEAAWEAVARAQREGRELLLESEALVLIAALDFAVPEHRVLDTPGEAESLDLSAFGGDHVVVKILSPTIVHKTEVGGVRVVERTGEAIAAAMERMSRSVSSEALAGFLVCEWIEHDHTFGGELLLGLRSDDELGPLVTLAPGGRDAEWLSEHLDDGGGAAIVSPSLAHAGDGLAGVIERTPFLRFLSEAQRGQPPRVAADTLARLLELGLEAARRLPPRGVAELEINPLVVTDRGPMALDAVARRTAVLPSGSRQPAAPRPLAKIRHLLEPRSIALVGASRTLNPGRLILRRLRAAGFAGNLWVVKPGLDSLDGYPCVEDLAALPGSVDLIILSVAAAQIPDLVEQILDGALAEAVIVIPGGLEEHPGQIENVRRIHESIERSRRRSDGGALLHGGNCLGVRSVPGRVDTLFIPEAKLAFPECEPAALALLSQSGALAITRASKLAELNPRYLITVGNQTDLTLGDYLTWLAEDPEISVVACYVEGFRPLDGLRFFEAAGRIRDRGGAVVLYRAGRTSAGTHAAASHTAAVAGSYRSTRALAEAAGVFVADTLDELTEMTDLLCRLRERPLEGCRLGALSNAGFECVAMADHAQGLELATLEDSTRQQLAELFSRDGLDRLVSVSNPLDVTPMQDDQSFARAFEILLTDPGVDLGLVGCVPLTAALDTLGDTGELALRLGSLFDESTKPWACVIDAGALYDPLVAQLERAGVPTFRSADRAVRLLARWSEWSRRWHSQRARLSS